MKNTLPRSDFAHFEMIKGRLKFKNFDKDEESKVTSYHAACEADSGSGQWVKVNYPDSPSPSKDEDNTRSVLVAVFTSGVVGDYDLNGKLEHGVCGSNMILDSGKMLIEGNSAIKSFHEKILGFIKKYAKISKSKGKGA